MSSMAEFCTSAGQDATSAVGMRATLAGRHS